MKKFLALLLVSILLLTSCAKGDDTPDKTETTAAETPATEPVETEKPQEGESVPLVKDGTSLYTILCENSDYLSYAENLQDVLYKKYGVGFPLSRKASDLGARACIVIGQVEGMDDGVYRGLTYNGYGVISSAEHIYVCAYNADTVGKAIQYWSSTMLNDYATKDTNGKVNVTLPGSTLFVRNPKYLKNGCTLFGKALSEYRMVVPADSNEVVMNLAENFQSEIGSNTGAYIAIVRDTTPASGPEILIGMTGRSESAGLYTAGADTFARGDMRVESRDSTISIGYNGAGALYAILDMLVSDCYNGRTDDYHLTTSLRASYLVTQPLDMTTGADIRVMSSNTLFANGHIKGSKFNDKTRIEVLGDYYLAFMPDSIGLQECIINNNVKYLEPVISDVYAWVPYESVASGEKTLYRKDKYDLVDHNIISLGNNYAFQWALLENKVTHQRYIHGNVHYHYNTDADRIPQAEQVNGELKKVMEKYGGVAIVVTGDYNTTLDSPVHEAMVKDIRMKSAVVVAPENMRDYNTLSWHQLDFTTFETEKNEQLDHIMVTTDTVEVIRHKVVNDALIASATDHYPILIDIRLK